MIGDRLSNRTQRALATISFLTIVFIFLAVRTLNDTKSLRKLPKPPSPCQVAAGKYFSHHRNVSVVSTEQTQADRNETFCTWSQYPDCFVLDVHGTEMLEEGLALQACQETYLTIHAIKKQNGRHVHCEPWVDIYARLVGPDLEHYPRPKEFNLYFNKVSVVYSGRGLFTVTIPPVESGRYMLDILLVHQENAKMELLTTINTVRCLDQPVVNSPSYLTVLDTGLCTKPAQTPLCTTGNVPGRWVTVPESGCDGSTCEGDINILSSSRRVWAPYNCHYKLFGPEEMKTCLAGKTTLLLGDSLTEEMANELIQIYRFNKTHGLVGKVELKSEGTWLGKPRLTSWRRLEHGIKIGFSFVFGVPLGCGLECFTRKNKGNLTSAYNVPKKIDLLIVLPGIHDATPRQGKNFNVFEKYAKQLPLFYDKVKHILSSAGTVIWSNIPESSDKARCDFNSKPKLGAINRITEDFVGEHPGMKFIDYFGVSEGCQCGDLHKGIRFFQQRESNVTYNGFLSRMAVHMALTMYCHGDSSHGGGTQELLAKIYSVE